MSNWSEAAGNSAATPIGIAKLSKLAFDGTDLKPLWEQLIDKFIGGSSDPAMLMDLATLEQLFGRQDSGLARQAEALEQTPLYRSPCEAAAPGLRLLAFAAPGELGCNTPLEFLVEGSDIALHTLYVLPGRKLPDALPEHDLAFVAIGQSDDNLALLAELEPQLPAWPKPVLNTPARIAQLARERLWLQLGSVPGVLIPPTLRLERRDLAGLAADDRVLQTVLPSASYPLILRPAGSHAGLGLTRVEDAAAIGAYLAEHGERQFYLSPFIDYRGADGLFRKYRIVFIGGRAYACHMGVSEHWMIHYLNAGMRESAAKRAEEAHFLTDFDADFGRRHEATLTAIAERIGLDYFAIDCGEMPDGRLLLFEADIAMIVHAMDSPEVYPYKPPQMRKVFAAFRALLRDRAGLTD